MKKFIAVLSIVTLAASLVVGCGKKPTEGNWTVANTFTYNDIANWKSMQTPVEGSGSGSIVETNTADGFVTIKAADDGWGGVESDYIEIDLSKDPMILAQVFESPDGSNWGMKIVPENPIEDHQWGLYVIPDNNMKWNKYAGADLKEALGEDFISIYGEKVKVKLWIYPTGGPEATVSVSQIQVVNQK